MKKNIFTPKSIAVIGASENKKKLGFQVLKNIIDGGYRGKIYPINNDPKIKKILGLKNYTSVLKIKGKIDMVVFLIPAKFVASALEECGNKKVDFAVIISAGFKEVGPSGEALEKNMLKVAQKYKIRILGPNCLGYIDTSIKLNASFAQEMPKSGNVAVVSQSGAVCTAILDWALSSNIGFSKFFSLGNKSDITELDIFPYLAHDNNTNVIVTYLESIAQSEKNNFKKIVEKVANKKPTIILKAGITEKGASAIASHTGSLAGSNEAVSALFKQSGVMRANSLEDIFDWAEAFSQLKKPKSNRVAIITNAGGPGVMITDAVEATRLELATLSIKTQKKLKKVLPPAANTHNPIDVIGDADALRYKNALDIVEKDSGVDAILVLLTPQTSTQIKETSELILNKIKRSDKTIIPVFMGGKKVREGIRMFEKESKAVFEYPERAVKALEKISFCQSCEMGIGKIYPPKTFRVTKVKKQKINNIIIKNSQSTLIAGPTADEILRQYQIPVIKSKTVATKREAIRTSRKFGFPLVFKINSPDIVHKSDVGGVIVGIKNKKEAGAAFSTIMKNVKKASRRGVIHNALRINGIDIYEMLSGGVEFFIGAKRDPIYGPLIGFGLGGIYVEILKDVSFRLAPLSEFDIEKMLGELKSSKIISGARGKSALNKKGIVDALIKVSNLMINHPQIKELDINPLKVFEDRVVALDNRMII